MSSTSASVTVIPNAAMDSPCAYSLFPGSVITGAVFVGVGSGGSDRSGGSDVCAAAATVTSKVAVDSSVPSEAVMVTVCVFTSASAATVPDTVPAKVT